MRSVPRSSQEAGVWMWATPQVLVLTPSANTSAIGPSARMPLHQSHVIPLEKVWGCWPVLVHISNPSN